MAELIACLPGDGIGPEVLDQAVRVLGALPIDSRCSGCRSAARRSTRPANPLPPETLAACREARGVLLGAVGGPRWDGGSVRPEQGLIGLRKALDVYANLRPARSGDIDLVIVRELVGGLYYGARGVRDDGTVFDTCEYHPSQVSALPGARSRSPNGAAASWCRSTRRTSSTLHGSGAASSARSRPSIRTCGCVTHSSTASRWRSSPRPSASTSS
jgi:3-isopropylmalate dehydrogenase